MIKPINTLVAASTVLTMFSHLDQNITHHVKKVSVDSVCINISALKMDTKCKEKQPSWQMRMPTGDLAKMRVINH